MVQSLGAGHEGVDGTRGRGSKDARETICLQCYYTVLVKGDGIRANAGQVGQCVFRNLIAASLSARSAVILVTVVLDDNDLVSNKRQPSTSVVVGYKKYNRFGDRWAFHQSLV